jgi:hypothetical protein
MRTDMHSPAAFMPEDYEYIGAFDQYPEPGAFCNPGPPIEFTTNFGTVLAFTYDHAEYTAGRNLLAASGAKIHYDPENGSCDCDHCGARIRYVAIFKHRSGEHIAVGSTCAAERFGCSTRMEYEIKMLKVRAANTRERTKAMGKAAEFVEANCPELAAWILTPDAEKVHEIFLDLARKLIKWGSLSEKQVAFARKLLQEHFERQRNGGKTDLQLAREAEKARAKDVPEGRLKNIPVEVLKTDVRDTRRRDRTNRHLQAKRQGPQVRVLLPPHRLTGNPGRLELNPPP